MCYSTFSWCYAGCFDGNFDWLNWIRTHFLFPSKFPTTISTWYFANANWILSSSFEGSVYNLNETESIFWSVILPNILGEFPSDRFNSWEVVILCVGTSLGMKSDTAAQRIMIDFEGKYFLISNMPFKYM